MSRIPRMRYDVVVVYDDNSVWRAQSVGPMTRTELAAKLEWIADRIRHGESPRNAGVRLPKVKRLRDLK
jgi:hypothetical protein